jgi:glycosyltransferase involved in cell wall biosynthesis
MPKVIQIVNRLNLGGIISNAALLTKYMPANYQTIFVTGPKQESEESAAFILEELGLTYIEVPEMRRSINPFLDRTAYKRLRNIIRDFRPDIVHTHAAKSGALGRLAARHENVPVILHTFHGHIFHSYFNPLVSNVFVRIERYLAGISDGIIAISDRQKEELGSIHKICSPEKINVIPYGFDLSKFRKDTAQKRKLFRTDYSIADDEISIGIIGRLVPIKNHSLFLKAISIIQSKTQKKLRFMIVGDGEVREALLKECESLNLDFTFYPDRQKNALVTFTSWRKDVDVVLNGLDIVALSSLNEGTPVSLIEAQAAEKAIITTDVGGVRNAVLPGKTAIIVASNDENAFAEGLLELIEHPDERIKMATSGWDFVREHYHYTRLVKDTQSLYERLLSAKVKTA